MATRRSKPLSFVLFLTSSQRCDRARSACSGRTLWTGTMGSPRKACSVQQHASFRMFDERSSNANPMQKLRTENLAQYHSRCLAHVSQLSAKCRSNILLHRSWEIETSPVVDNSTIHHFLQIREDGHYQYKARQHHFRTMASEHLSIQQLHSNQHSSVVVKTQIKQIWLPYSSYSTVQLEEDILFLSQYHDTWATKGTQLTVRIIDNRLDLANRYSSERQACSEKRETRGAGRIRASTWASWALMWIPNSCAYGSSWYALWFTVCNQPPKKQHKCSPASDISCCVLRQKHSYCRCWKDSGKSAAQSNEVFADCSRQPVQP